jgi:hypothetical protein
MQINDQLLTSTVLLVSVFGSFFGISVGKSFSEIKRIEL